jgi:hypothetical protein
MERMGARFRAKVLFLENCCGDSAATFPPTRTNVLRFVEEKRPSFNSTQTARPSNRPHADNVLVAWLLA